MHESSIKSAENNTISTFSYAALPQSKKEIFVKLKSRKVVGFSEIETICIELLCYEFSYKLIAEIVHLSKYSVIVITKNCCQKVQAKNIDDLKKIIRQSNFISIVLARIKSGKSVFSAFCD